MARSHHPLPKDDRARHDLIPEEMEDGRPLGEDDPDAPTPSSTTPPKRQYRDVDGRPYET